MNFISSIFLVTILLHQCSSPVESALPPLVASVCPKTEHPNYCIQCMDSLPMPKNTIRDLASVAIQCPLYQSRAVEDQLIQYAESTHYPEGDKCANIYGGVKNTLLQAAASLRGGKLVGAKNLLDSADSQHLGCFNLLNGARRPIPRSLSVNFEIFRAFDRVAKNIIGMI